MLRNKLVLSALAFGLVAAACGDAVDQATSMPTVGQDQASTPTPTSDETSTLEPTTTRPPSPTPSGPLDTAHVRNLFAGWDHTDPETLTVDPTEIIRGCFGADCIPALDVVDAVSMPNPNGGEASFGPLSEVDLDSQLPVAVITVNGQTRGCPLHIMTFHEIVNDSVGGVPVAVTFCPLCNTALTFERTIDREVLDFGVSGNLRNSDLIMFDRQTESWWQQAVGEAIDGPLQGTLLVAVEHTMQFWFSWAAFFPETDIWEAV